MKRNWWLRVYALAAMVAWSSWAAQMVAAQIPAPNPMDIFCGDNKLGTLEITDYTAATDTDGTKGARIKAKFVTANPGMVYNFKWIQSIYDGKGTIGQKDGAALPYLDPYGSGKPPMREDNLPWYWTEPENSDDGIGANGTNGPGTRFSDFASQDPRNAGNFIKFETAFVCVDGLNISYLKGFTWGYKINADMTSTADPFAWLTAPTANLTGPTEAWDGTLNPKGGGKPVGYKFTDVCNCPCVPEPSSTVSILIGLSVIGVTATYRRMRYRLSA